MKKIFGNNRHTDAEQKKVLIIAVNDDRYFLSHRFEVGKGAVDAGWRVIVAAGENGGRDRIEGAGMEYYPLPFYGNGMSLRLQWQSLVLLTRLLRREKGATLHLVGMKMLPVGNVAARISGGVRVLINAVCGMGSIFQNPKSLKARMMLRLLRLTKLKGRKSGTRVTTIVQNRDDERLLIDGDFLLPEETVYIKGSGVDLDRYRFRELEERVSETGRKRVIFSGRLLRSKGVADLIAAAESLRKDWEEDVEFLICGGVSGNKDSMSAQEMENLCDGKYIRWAGHCEDMASMLATARLIAFPSYYREGVPLALIEASAIGLPIVTCDSVGCRDTIDGNGIMVAPGDVDALAAAIRRLLEDDELCRLYGRRSRRLAERDYDLRRVVDRHLSLYSATPSF